LNCLSALASIKCQIAIIGLTTAATIHARFAPGNYRTFRWQFSLIGQRASEEGRLAAEISTKRTRRDVRVESVMRTKLDARRRRRFYGFVP
jgi:hypothetical protein